MKLIYRKHQGLKMILEILFLRSDSTETARRRRRRRRECYYVLRGS
jgi:hypothetical protein